MISAPHHSSGFNGSGLGSGSRVLLSSAALDFMSPTVTGRSWNIGSFSSNFTTMTAQTNATLVAMNDVPMMAEGLTDLLTARMPTAVTGMSWMELVLMARKVHMALDAVPGRGLSDSKSSIARMPRGVAALERPSMFAAMFMSMEPMAGW